MPPAAIFRDEEEIKLIGPVLFAAYQPSHSTQQQCVTSHLRLLQSKKINFIAEGDLDKVLPPHLLFPGQPTELLIWYANKPDQQISEDEEIVLNRKEEVIFATVGKEKSKRVKQVDISQLIREMQSKGVKSIKAGTFREMLSAEEKEEGDEDEKNNENNKSENNNKEEEKSASSTSTKKSVVDKIPKRSKCVVRLWTR